MMICSDVILKISEFLTDNEKIKLSMTCISMDKLKHKFMYCEKIHINRITNLSYFDNFEYVVTHGMELKCPKHVKHIYYDACMFSFIIPHENLHSLTHLTFGEYYNGPIDKIPLTITHLSFGRRFNQPINDLSPTVKEIIIFKNYNLPINDDIMLKIKYRFC